MGLGIVDYALNGLPAFEDCLFPMFPLGMDRAYENARFNVEMKCALVVKADGDSETFGCGNDFHRVNGLVFDFGEAQPCCTLDVSQFAPPSAGWLGLHECS